MRARRAVSGNLERCESAGVNPDVITYSSAISACEKGGQWQRALDLLARCESAGIKPNVITYNSAISACEKGRQWQRARTCWNAVNPPA